MGIPVPAPHEVRRHRLLEVLHSHSSRALLLLAAPAGFGKSTLAATYARESGAAVAWLTLSATDRDSRTLFRHLASAFEQAFEEHPLGIQPGAQVSPVSRLLDGVARSADGVGLARLLLEDLHQAPEGFILVLDDFHVVQDGDEVVEAVGALLRDLPESGQVVITSREMPPLQMARLVAADAVFALGAEDLRFTPDEVAELRRSLGGDSSQDDQAEGWVAGLLLGGAPRQLGVMGGAMLGSYVEREVLGRLKPTEQRWLESLAVFETITPLAAEGLLGPGPWPSRLAALQERCPFLVGTTGGSAYRLHGLVREALLGRLRRGSPARAARAWSVACEMAEVAGDVGSLVRACQEMGRTREAVAYVRRTVDEALQMGRFGAAVSNLQLLEERVRRADPELSLAEAHALMQTGAANDAYAIAETVLHQAGRTGDLAFQVRAVVELLAISFYKGDHQAVDDWYAAVQHLLPEAHIEENERRRLDARARGVRGISYAVRGEMALAIDALEEAARILARLGGISRELANVQNNLAKGRLACGDYGGAREASIASISGWRVLGDQAQLAVAQLILGDISFRTGELEAAGAAYTSARDTARMAGAQRTEAFATLSVGAWHHANGRLTEAVEQFEVALSLGEQLSDRELLLNGLRRRAEAAIALGETARARALLARAQGEAEALRSPYQVACVDRALGRLYVAEGATAFAESHLRRSIERGDGVWGPDDAALAHFWLGTAQLLLGRVTEAQGALQIALDRAEAAGSLALLASAAAEDPRLLEHAENSRLEPHRSALLRSLVDARRPWLVQEGYPTLELVARNESARLEVRLFGGFEAYSNGEPVVPMRQLRTDRGRQLLALLVIHPNGLSSQELIRYLVADSAPHKAHQNLMMTVYLLRKQLRSPGSIRNAAGVYQIAPQVELWADVRAFDAALSRASRAASDAEAIPPLQEAVGYFRAPLLAGMEWEWAVPLREAYRERFVRAALRLASLLARSDSSSADALARRVLEIEPDHPEAHERLLENARARGDETSPGEPGQRQEATHPRIRAAGLRR